MAFNTFSFYLFFIAIFLVHVLLPLRWRWAWLLLASLVFYGLGDVGYSFVLLACILITYVAGQGIAKNDTQKGRQGWMTAGILLNVAALAGFKYLDFLFETLNGLLAAVGLHWTLRGMELLAPLGISFYVFQALSYIWDVYDGKVAAEKNLGYFALYLSFFPKLLSGPLERYQDFRAQLTAHKRVNLEAMADHLLRIGWGLFKKIVIADRLAVVVDTVFAAPQDFASPKLVLAVAAYAFQVYLDFSAYTDIAIGIAGMLGFELSENFKRPYLAISVIDFWRRWHITLSTWLRDYIFLPLEYKDRRKQPRKLWMSLHMLVTFLISGLWHGANWTFVVWGGLHGFYQALELLTQPVRDRLVKRWNINRDAFLHRAFQILLTFLLVCLGWLFFRAESLAQAGGMLKAIFTLKGLHTPGAWKLADGSLGLDNQDLGLLGVALLGYIGVEILQGKHDLLAFFKRQPTWLRWTLYYALFFAITIFGFYGEVTGADFVYMQF